MSHAQHITIADEGRVLAAAEVRSNDDAVQAELRVEAGHLPTGTRTRLVDAVLDLSTADPAPRCT